MHRTLTTILTILFFLAPIFAQGLENALECFANILNGGFVILGLMLIYIHFLTKSYRLTTALLLLGYGFLIILLHLVNYSAGHNIYGYSFWDDFSLFIHATVIAVISLAIALIHFVKRK